MTLTDEQIQLLKRVATAAVPNDEFSRMRGDMEVLHKQVDNAIRPQLVQIVLTAQLNLLQGAPLSEVLIQMYVSGFAMGMTFAEHRELERLGSI